MKTIINSITSTNGKNQLHVVVWKPEGEIRAIVQISHGMVEYIERYDEFAEFLSRRNFLVIGNDHLGHGKTAASDPELGYFGAEKSRTVVDDLHEVTKFAKKTYGKELPYFLFGHSMGSFMARRYLMTYGDEVSGAILSGTGYIPGAILDAGRGLAWVVRAFAGEYYRPSSLKKMAFGSYNRRIPDAKTEHDWISRNEKNVEAYSKDKYCTFSFTVNGYQTLFGVLKFIQKRKNYERIPKKLPIFLISGKEDPVGNYGKGVLRVADQYKKCGIKDVKVKLYEEDRHELTNETDREIVFEDVFEWIQKEIKSRTKSNPE
ncbi:alpha/beta fold hydrolase [Brotaphodocola sp.]|uniref:alpha/beta fold hydrolase n=1 Tax=Brotaphodocola sp. TaxID=3073577 RepID=UPI003D7E5FE2